MGINATEWAAYAEGLDIKQMRSQMNNMQTNVGNATNNQTYCVNNYAVLAGELKDTQANLEDEESSLEETKEDIIKTQEQCKEDVETEKLDTLSKEITVKKFAPDQGMNCGMGMGMGDTYTDEGAITLTIEELNALSDVLADFSEDTNQTDNSTAVANHLNNTLTSGATASTGQNEDGTKFVEIKRANGSSVKICDANGNGALDVKDYAFCEAIEQAKKAIEKMNANVESIENRAEAKQQDLEDKQAEHEENILVNKTKIKNLETNELPEAQLNIEKADEKFAFDNKEFNKIKNQLAKKEQEEKTNNCNNSHKQEKTENKQKQGNNLFTTNTLSTNQNNEVINKQKLFV